MDTQENKAAPRADKLDIALDVTANVLMLALMIAPEFAQAQAVGSTAAFGGISDFLKMIANLLVFEWGYYIGIITLAIQGFRWKTGRIDLMTLGGWGLGIGIVFFAPSIVKDLRSRTAGTI